MKMPTGVTEEQVLEAIENAVKILAPSFTFGIYDIEDIKQEARTFGLEAIGRYDTSRPLDNFIYSHIRNRLINLKRDKFKRNDPPCLVCHHAEGGRTQHPSGEFCTKYTTWKRRNEAKANLQRPLDLEHITDNRQSQPSPENDAAEIAGLNEMLVLIDTNLPVDMRATYLQMRAGKSVPKSKRVAVEAAVKEILKDALELKDED
jgi:DNA-directed RNA polymerase specialized sigma24 family protein